MKQHIPWRTVQTNPFNKDMFKGNQEKINDWDLDTTLYVYEPQSLADLGDDASELDYQKVWNKFEAGGHINIYLVPYREMPELKVEVTSIAADYDGLDKNETIAAYTNVPMGDRPTKRFYSFKPLTESVDPIIDLEIFEENNLTEVINNDSTFKQTTFTLNKFQVYDGGEGSYYRDVRFFYGVFKPDDVDLVQISTNVPSIFGGTAFNGVKGDTVEKDIDSKIDYARTSVTEVDRWTFWEWGQPGEVIKEYTLDTSKIIDVYPAGISNLEVPIGTYGCNLEAADYSLPTEAILQSWEWEIIDANTLRIIFEIFSPGGGGGECFPGSVPYFRFLVKELLGENEFNVVSFGSINEGETTINYNGPKLYPHLVVPTVTENGIHWNVPWTWEYMYANEQVRGDYYVKFITDGKNDNNSPSKEKSGWTDLTGEYIYGISGDEYIPFYRHLQNGDLASTQTANQIGFFLPYFIEYALPRGLSSHGSVYVNSNDNESSGGLLNLAYSDGTHNGARAVNTESGTWSTKSTMFAWDLSYDPTVIAAGGDVDFFLSELEYGAFYQSADYVNLIDEIIDEKVIYDGNIFTSKLGVLEDIDNKEFDRDIRQWNLQNDWTLALMPWDIQEISQGYKADTPLLLDSKVFIGQSNPKIDLGILDFKAATLRTTTTNGFNGKYIEDKKAMDYYPEDYKQSMLFDNLNQDPSQIILNYYGFGSGVIKFEFFKTIDGQQIKTYEVEYLNERAQGRNLSGGTVITWL